MTYPRQPAKASLWSGPVLASLLLASSAALGTRVAQAQDPPAQQAQPALTRPAPPALLDKPPELPMPAPMNRQVIVLDPGHGGTDSGSRIGDTILEKDVTLALAFRLRSLLTARGFTVVMTREGDTASVPGVSGGALTLDDRAGLANHARASACLLLHATAAGNGMHLYSSGLTPAPLQVVPLPWLTAQAAWVPQSRQLEQQLGLALQRAGVATVLSRASVRPVDSLICPALVAELAPESEDPNSVMDPDYQQRVASALASALVFWPQMARPPLRQPDPGRSAPNAPVNPAAAAAPGAQP